VQESVYVRLQIRAATRAGADVGYDCASQRLLPRYGVWSVDSSSQRIPGYQGHHHHVYDRMKAFCSTLGFTIEEEGMPPLWRTTTVNPQLATRPKQWQMTGTVRIITLCHRQVGTMIKEGDRGPWKYLHHENGTSRGQYCVVLSRRGWSACRIKE
jgi:hypothetical protein